jgi:adenylate cyclase
MINQASDSHIETLEIQDALSRVEGSKLFANSKRLIELLRFVVEAQLRGDTAGLKQTAIGIELYRRDPSYDPKLDGIVRTHARRLRERLVTYYRSEGAHDAVVIELPRGGYVPSFRRREVFAGEETVWAGTADEWTHTETTGELELWNARKNQDSPAPAKKAPFYAQLSRIHHYVGEAHVLGVPLLIIIPAALMLGAALIGGLAYRRPAGFGKSPTTAAKQNLPRVAVLRFRSAGTGSEGELYGRALADSVVASLARMNELSVVQPPESSSGPAVNATDAQLAEELKANYVVSGRFEKSRKVSKLSVKLTEHGSGTVVWSHDYSFPWANLVEIEDAMAGALSQNLAQRVQESTANQSMPVSREAQQAYLDGYASLQAAKSRFQLEMLETAERNLRHAIELNPGYPDALAALADAEMLSLFIKDELNKGVLDSAERHAREALARNPQHSGAHAALSGIAIVRGHVKAAFEEAKKAVDADPAGAQALSSLGEVYEAMGLYEAALDAYHRAARQRSLASTEPLMNGALLATRMGRFAEAEGMLNSLTGLDAESPYVAFARAYALERKKDYPAAEVKLEELREGVAKNRPGSQQQLDFIDAGIGLVQAQQGRFDNARRVLHKIGKPRARMSDFVILLAAASNEPAMAIENLRLNPYYRNYRYLVTEQGLKPLYRDAAFQQLLSDTYPEWVKMLAEQSEVLAVPPPVLPAPAGFLKSSGLETRATD